MKPAKIYNNFHSYFREDSKEVFISFPEQKKVIKAILPAAYMEFNKKATVEQLTKILYEYLVNISYLNSYSDSQIIRESVFASKKYKILNESVVNNIAEEVCYLKTTNSLLPIYSFQNTIFNPNIILSTLEKKRIMMKINKPIMIKKSVETRNKNGIIRTTEKLLSILNKWHLKKYGYPTNKKLTLLTGIAERDLTKHCKIVNFLIEDLFSKVTGINKTIKEDLPKIEAIDAVFLFTLDNNWQIKSMEDKKLSKLYNKIKELKIKKEDKMKLKLTIDTPDRKIKIECEIEQNLDAEKLDDDIAIAISFGNSYSSTNNNDMYTPSYKKYENRKQKI